MALPPHILRIKRKRDDDPVESLYLNSQHTESKRRVTTSAAEFVFKRLVEQPSPTPPVQRTANGIPRVIATQPGEERDFIRRWQHPAAQTNLASMPVVLSSIKPPRVFHLSRSEVSSSKPPLKAKRRRTLHHEVDIAVFVEDRKHAELQSASTRNDDRNLNPTEGSKAAAAQSLAAPSSSPKKRPRTPATGSRLHTPIPASDEGADSEMREALQRYAEEFESDHDKPDAMDTSNDQTYAPCDDEAEFIYDTYVRYSNTLENLPHRLAQAALDDASPMSRAAGNPPDTASFGYLVIPEADQTLWKTYYASDASSGSERDWDSEEDDENHENYYGADYPEDEVSSEDDRQENPYRYRKGSDDEESNSGTEAWSDEDGEKKPPWLTREDPEDLSL